MVREWLVDEIIQKDPYDFTTSLDLVGRFTQRLGSKRCDQTTRMGGFATVRLREAPPEIRRLGHVGLGPERNVGFLLR